MGHHAQYRKRGSNSTGDIYVVQPPASYEWELRVNDSSLEIRLIVTPVVPRYGLIPQWQLGQGPWFAGPSGHILNEWFPINDHPGAGDYGVSVRWSDSITHLPISGYSAIKRITIPP